MSDASAAEFEPFPKIARLRRGCTITEKIDGTNAQILITDGGVYVGSRTRWITPGKMTDNYGFAEWVNQHVDALVSTLGPGRHYGEWWGAGIQRRYGLSERRFSLFNPTRYAAVDFAAAGLDNVGTVPVLWHYAYSDDAITTALDLLRYGGSVAAPGYMNPEGIVVYHHATRALAKITLDGDGHKETKAA